MMKQVFFTVLLLGLISCDQKEEFDETVVTFEASQLSEKIEAAYNRQSNKDLDQFFNEWNKSVQQNSRGFIYQNETVKTIYDIYLVFYNPLNLLKLGDWEWGNYLNSGSKYVVVQNKIFFHIMPNDNLDVKYWELEPESISDFRPPVDMNPNKVLYLTEEYKKALNIFLGSESTELGEGGIMNPSRPQEESQKRYEFLRTYIPILHGHWGGYWHIETHPEISRIFINKKLNKAKISFRVGYQGGDAILSKTGNNWRIESSMATWIE